MSKTAFSFFLFIGLVFTSVANAAYQDEPGAKLRWLDKVTARTGIVELHNDESAKYGDLVIRVKACRVQDPLEGADSAAFVQVWENKTGTDPEWVYSGWMFSSSPGMAAMDHPVYDVWVLGCIGRPAAPAQSTEDLPEAMPDAASVDDTSAAAPDEAGTGDTKNIDEIVDENASSDPIENAVDSAAQVPVEEEATPGDNVEQTNENAAPMEDENAAQNEPAETSGTSVQPSVPAPSEPDYDAPFNGYKH